MRNVAAHRQPTRRTVLRWSIASALGLTLFPTIAAAQSAPEAASPPPIDDWPDLNPIGPQWAVTTGEASLRATPDLADNRFGFARAGTPLQILNSSGDWTYVYNPHTQGTAYVSSSLLAPGDAPSPYVSRPAPPLTDQIPDTVVLTEDTILANYPTPDP